MSSAAKSAPEMLPTVIPDSSSDHQRAPLANQARDTGLLPGARRPCGRRAPRLPFAA
jgi:hypothetical protein